MDGPIDVLPQVRVRNRWAWRYTAWSLVHYGFGIATIALAVTIAARLPPDTADDHAREILAYALAILISISILLEPQKRADRFRRASATLSSAITIYSLPGSRYSIEDVIVAQFDGEALINEYRVQLSGPAGRRTDIALEEAPPA